LPVAGCLGPERIGATGFGYRQPGTGNFDGHSTCCRAVEAVASDRVAALTAGTELE
jgi:hypothetical protein